MSPSSSAATRLVVKYFRRAVFLSGLTLLLASGFLLVQRQTSGPVAFATPPATSASESVSADTGRLVISSLHIDLPITEAKVSVGVWPLSTTGIIHIAGTNVFYGHNWPKLLGPLPHIQVGDTVSIGNIAYTVSEVHTVWPSEASILSKASATTIVLYTCTGFLDTQRFVVIASR